VPFTIHAEDKIIILHHSWSIQNRVRGHKHFFITHKPFHFTPSVETLQPHEPILIWRIFLFFHSFDGKDGTFLTITLKFNIGRRLRGFDSVL
jgi:hypothetical protein